MENLTNTTSPEPNANMVLADVLLKDCTIRPLMVIGQKVPNEISFSYNGGCGWINMSSFRIDSLFKIHFKNLYGIEYEFSEICRNENEKKAFELSIEENCQSLGLKVTRYLS